MQQQITIQPEGRRIYLMGNTYPIKNKIKGIGGKWDADRRAWWVGSSKRDKVESLVDSAPAPVASSERRYDDKVSDDTKIIGRARYKGKDGYLILWEGMTKRGARAAKLAFRDGSKAFWADSSEIEITKTYDESEDRYGRRDSMTFGKLNRLAEKYKKMSEEERYARQYHGGVCRCQRPLDEGDGSCMVCGYGIV